MKWEFYLRSQLSGPRRFVPPSEAQIQPFSDNGDYIPGLFSGQGMQGYLRWLTHK